MAAFYALYAGGMSVSAIAPKLPLMLSAFIGSLEQGDRNKTSELLSGVVLNRTVSLFPRKLFCFDICH